MSNLHIQEFIFELEKHYAKEYTTAERDRMERNLKDCDLEYLKNILHKNYDKLPPVKEVINKAGFVKAKEKSEGFDGCDYCQNGFIRAYNIWLNRKEGIYKPVAELDRITHPGMLIPELNLYAKCPCTKQGTIDKLFEIMDGLFVSHYQHYELLYVSLWFFANSYLPGKSFPDFDNFNPFRLWKCPDRVLLKKKDLKYYRHLLENRWRSGSQPTTPPRVEGFVEPVKKIYPEQTQKIYDIAGEKVQLNSGDIPF